jgi:ribosomal protein S18 acetylase RimI-like enzyme
MPITYRPARLEDLQRAGELVVRSMNDFSERHGFGPMATVRPPSFSVFSLGDDPEGLWVAEDAGELLGFAFSWVCGDLWFLAQLFVSPGQQGRGIGQELLKRTFEHAEKAKAAVKALITFTFNNVSQGLYIRHGLFPRCPIYNFKVARETVVSNSRGALLRCAPLKNTVSHLRSLAKIDAQVLGVSRAKHHRFLTEDGTTKGILLYRGDDCVGYAYIADGHIGPLAVTQEDSVGAALRTALNLAAEGTSAQLSAFIPGFSEAALSVAIEHGMQITMPMVLMSTHDFGNWSQYLPRNPGFM